MENYQWLLTLQGQLLIAFLGMLMHFFKKKIRGESAIHIVNYFATHLKSTIIAAIITAVSTAAYHFQMQTGTATDLLAIFGIGYLCDSSFNKWE